MRELLILAFGLTLAGCGGNAQQPSLGSTSIQDQDVYEQGRGQAEVDAAYQAGYDSLAQEQQAAQAVAEADASAIEAERKACEAKALGVGQDASAAVQEAHAAELTGLDEAIDVAFEAPVDTFDERAVAAHDAGVGDAITRRDEAAKAVDAEAEATGDRKAEAEATVAGCPLND